MAAAAYIALPFHTVWNIREATRTGDTAYLAAKIDWASLKQTLKPSIAQMALGLPPEGSGAASGDAGATGSTRTLWQRFKAYMGAGMVDRIVESYVTPEGLPKLFSYKKTYNSVRDSVAGAEPESKDMTFGERFKRFWARVERAEFTSLTRFEIDVRDKLMPERRFDGVLELRGLEWKLTELRVRDSNDGKGVAASAPLQVLTDAGTPVDSSVRADHGPPETLPTDK